MTKDEALKLALEALEEPRGHIAKHRRLEAITAIKEALAQPETEPKKIPESLATHGSLWIESLFSSPQSEQESDDLTAAYLSGVYDGKNKNAPQRKPLTDEQWQEIAAITGCLRIEKRGRDAILRVLEEAAHGIKE